MFLLYKDPNGESIEESMSGNQNGNSRLSFAKKTDPRPGELEERIASLERKLKEKDEVIDKMKKEMETSQKVRLFMKATRSKYLILENYCRGKLQAQCWSSKYQLNQDIYISIVIVKTT